MTVRSVTRQQVMAHIISFMAEAEQRGLDPWKAAEHAFPSIPGDVVAAAWVELDARKTEAWWQAVEKTIDGELIDRAITSAGGAS